MVTEQVVWWGRAGDHDSRLFSCPQVSTHTGTRTPHNLCFSLVPWAGPVLGFHSISYGHGLDARPIMK